MHGDYSHLCVTEAADCGQLKAPSNGGVNVDGTNIGATAVYYCKEGFALSGNAQRICKPNGRWSGSAPSCHSKSDHSIYILILTQLPQDYNHTKRDFVLSLNLLSLALQGVACDVDSSFSGWDFQ